MESMIKEPKQTASELAFALQKLADHWHEYDVDDKLSTISMIADELMELEDWVLENETTDY